ncbi:hypothetical protein WMF27_28240 [Sorangium sp. So ce281]|uniref:hypothetical protein n=1 Tax=unclassified Sorangium TaxID=2621164 RepID=UPI003F63455E
MARDRYEGRDFRDEGPRDDWRPRDERWRAPRDDDQRGFRGHEGERDAFERGSYSRGNYANQSGGSRQGELGQLPRPYGQQERGDGRDPCRAGGQHARDDRGGSERRWQEQGGASARGFREPEERRAYGQDSPSWERIGGRDDHFSGRGGEDERRGFGPVQRGRDENRGYYGRDYGRDDHQGREDPYRGHGYGRGEGQDRYRGGDERNAPGHHDGRGDHGRGYEGRGEEREGRGRSEERSGYGDTYNRPERRPGFGRFMGDELPQGYSTRVHERDDVRSSQGQGLERSPAEESGRSRYQSQDRTWN